LTPTFLENISKMKEKNLAVEMLKKLVDEQVKVYKRTNLVKSEAFSELIQQTLNRSLNGMLTNEEVIQELLKLAKEMLLASEKGNKLGLTDEELAFYDALTKPDAVRDFYTNEDLVVLTKELTETLRKNKISTGRKKNLTEPTCV
jgi:type I restriction enzyme R subunit